jgi:response regulator RpfG family c-di-GMP phosphodiesterase
MKGNQPKMERILFVDDEEFILSAFQREFRKDYEIATATGAEEGLRTLAARGPFSVIVSDFRMPNADGNRFLAAAKKIAPDSVRVMLTGHADLSMAVRAINEGSVFRFLTKPCPHETLGKVLAAAVQQYRLVAGEKDLLENTLKGTVKVLSELSGLVNPEAFGRSSRIRKRVRQLTEQLQVSNPWQLETAALLSQIGCVIFPHDLLTKCYMNEPLSEEELQLFNMHPEVGSGLIASIPRMDEVARIVRYQEKHFDGTGFPVDTTSGSEIPLGARILKVALDADVLETAATSGEEVLEILKGRHGWYDFEVLTALETLVAVKTPVETRSVTLKDLDVGMVLDEDLWSESGLVVIAKGQEVSFAMVLRLRQFARTSPVRQPFRVVCPSTKTCSGPHARDGEGRLFERDPSSPRGERSSG